MLDWLKNSTFKISCLMLILLTHYGSLGLTLEYGSAKLFYFTHSRILLLSTLVLSVFYVVSFPAFRILRKKENYAVLCLWSIMAISLILLVYLAFFAQENWQRQVVASMVLFLGVIALIAFCDARKSNAVWKNLQRISVTALLISGLILFYMYYDLIFYQKKPLTSDEKKFNMETSLINTAYYGVHFTRYHMNDNFNPEKLSDHIQDPAHISALDSKNFLLVDSLGNIYHLTLKQNTENNSPEENFYIKKLSTTLPIKYKQFALFKKNNTEYKTNFFGVTDIYTDIENGQLALYIGHHFWNSREKCLTLGISELTSDVSVLLESGASPKFHGKWRTLYETTPCFLYSESSSPLGPNHSGGRIVRLNKDSLLFSIGYHRPDMFKGVEDLPRGAGNSYGKIWKIDRHTGEAELVSWGHRNPQGLYRAPDGTIWETEHGPQGGDELNKIKPGKNYGWPHVLYGTEYGKFIWPLNANQDEHEGYEQPVFVWTPSIAVSNLIRVEGDLFPIWKNDLLVGSLKNQTLYRLQMHEDRVIYSEPIKINERIRDLAETPNGEIFIWTDSENMIRLRPADFLPREDETITEAGERLFYKCAGCHNAEPNAPHGIGPNLHKIYKNRIARHVEYNYSPALQARSAERWTRKNLDLFLQDPGSFAPGTTMQVKVPDDYERRALLHYLENN